VQHPPASSELLDWLLCPYQSGVAHTACNQKATTTRPVCCCHHGVAACLVCVLQIVLGVDMFALLAYNMSGMMVTDHLGAVFRTVLETMRTLFVWLLGLLLFYTPLGMGRLGESWTAWSFLQAAG